jgi:hypothetical protein
MTKVSVYREVWPLLPLARPLGAFDEVESDFNYLKKEKEIRKLASEVLSAVSINRTVL